MCESYRARKLLHFNPFNLFTPRRCLRVLVSLGELRTTKACLTSIIHLLTNRTSAIHCLLPPFVNVHRRQRGWPKSHESPHGRYGRVQVQPDYVVQVDLVLDCDSRSSIQCNLFFKSCLFCTRLLGLSVALLSFLAFSVTWAGYLSSVALCQWLKSRIPTPIIS